LRSSSFLVCDAPPASEQVIKYTGTVDGQSFQTPFSLHPAGKAIIYDMKDLIDSTQHVFSDIRACNALGCSDPAISFVSPPRPAAPEGLSFIN